MPTASPERLTRSAIRGGTFLRDLGILLHYSVLYPRRIISVPPRSTSLVDLRGPPGEPGGRANTVALPVQRAAPGEWGIGEVLKGSRGGNVLVDERRGGQRPQV